MSDSETAATAAGDGEAQGRALTKGEIERVDDAGVRFLLVPEWGEGVGVYIRAMNGIQRGKVEDAISAGKRDSVRAGDLYARVAVYCVCDSTGERLWKESDIPKVGQKSAAALFRIFEAALKASGMGEEAEAEAEGNSGDEESGSSGSD